MRMNQLHKRHMHTLLSSEMAVM